MSEGQDLETIHLDGMFHVGALAIVVTLGYLGLDRQIRGSLVDVENLLGQIKESLERLINTLDLRSPDGLVVIDSAFLFPRYWAYLSCVIAGQRHEIGRMYRILYFFRRQYHIPFLFAFRKKIDIYITTGAHLFCLCTFILISGVDTFKIDPFGIKPERYASFVYVSFVLYVLSIIWITLDIIMLLRLQNVQEVHKNCENALSKRAKAILQYKKNSGEADIARKLKD